MSTQTPYDSNKKTLPFAFTLPKVVVGATGVSLQLSPECLFLQDNIEIGRARRFCEELGSTHHVLPKP